MPLPYAGNLHQEFQSDLLTKPSSNVKRSTDVLTHSTQHGIEYYTKAELMEPSFLKSKRKMTKTVAIVTTTCILSLFFLVAQVVCVSLMEWLFHCWKSWNQYWMQAIIKPCNIRELILLAICAVVCAIGTLLTAVSGFPTLIIYWIASSLDSAGAQAPVQVAPETMGRAIVIESNATQHGIRYVTRLQIEEYVPNFNSQAARGFDYMSPRNSFCKIISLKDLEKSHKLRNNKYSTPREETCCICIEQFDDSKDILLLPCDHYFHVKCMKTHRATRRNNLNLHNEATHELSVDFRCFLCQLNLMKHYLYYKEHGITPDNVPYSISDV